MFLQFLGLAIARKQRPPTLIEDPSYFGEARRGFVVDEVKVVDLGGRFVALASSGLSSAELQLLANLYDAGSKATAHLTSMGSHDFDYNLIDSAVAVVVRLLKDNLYSPTKRPMLRYGLPAL
jgi:hypothetical protein